ncbi:MAG: hypothetical protein NTW91_04305, partial [Verrucomicrobia bacterium]|nr:hypothetical protein [Verrucomicrobiota bacterium]
SQYGLRQSVQRLYNPRTRKGLLQQARHNEAVGTAAELIPEIDRFFDALAGACTFRQGRECRIREDRSAELAEAVSQSSLAEGLAKLAESAGSAAGKTEEEGLKGELTEVASRLRSARAGLSDFLSQNAPDHVYWVERSGRTSTWCSLHAAPIGHYTEESRARAFVLFTSHRTMQAVAARMQGYFEEKGWNLIVQGAGLSRSRMLEAFREGGHSVLFGTDSFWTGVDLPGEALSSVIITRLPFVTPDHPLTEAKLEEIVASGGDAFQTYSLPEAILKLRQGVGRLIRSANDRGSIVILDSRILSRPYGKAFLKALPECPVEIA